MSNDTSWIREGAEVVVYSYGGGISPAWAKASVIERVYKQAFRVEGYDHLIRIQGQVHQGGAWDPSTHVIPIYDQRAEGVLRAEVSRRLLRATQADVRVWLKDSSLNNTAKALQSLQRLYDDQKILAQHQAAQED